MTPPLAADLGWGYDFAPHSPPHYPAHRRLTVVLRPAPTQAHYDPERMDLLIVNPAGDLEPLEVYYPWPRPESFRAAAGRVILHDRVGKKVEAFTFGGEVQVEGGPERVVARLESPAPVLALITPDSLANQLTAEVEVLLAQRRARWDQRGQPDELDTRLARVAPRELYRACLKALRDSPSFNPRPRTRRERERVFFILHELAGLPAEGPGLDELL
jgi:hypothetical protein